MCVRNDGAARTYDSNTLAVIQHLCRIHAIICSLHAHIDGHRKRDVLVICAHLPYVFVLSAPLLNDIRLARILHYSDNSQPNLTFTHYITEWRSSKVFSHNVSPFYRRFLDFLIEIVYGYKLIQALNSKTGLLSHIYSVRYFCTKNLSNILKMMV